jgi:hypothetical protein
VKTIRTEPIRYPKGQMDWASFGAWFDVMRDQLFASMDVRDHRQGKLHGRAVTLPTLEGLIDDDGRALSQRFLHQVSTANRHSVQSADVVMTGNSGAGAGTASITIDGHSVKFDFGSVAYNGGSVSGLDPETDYYVFADDVDRLGGAVVYEATEDPDDMIAKGRYYVGIITTPLAGNSSNVTDATSANPIVIEIVGHGWSSAQEVSFAAMPDDFGTALNGNDYAITVIDPDHFSIPVDGSLFLAYTSGGTATRLTSSVQSGGGAGAGVGGHRFDLR